MTATIATTPVELVEKIFVDMGIGPNEAMSMAGDFIVRAAVSPLRLGTDRSVPPTGELEEGNLLWAGGKKRPPVTTGDGAVLLHYVTPLPGPWAMKLDPSAARVTAAHLRAAADAADRQAAQAAKEAQQQNQEVTP